MRTVLTIDGDMIDALVAAHYGVDDEFSNVLAQVLSANAHLAPLPPVLPAGLIVNLPDRAPRTMRGSLRLWG